MPDHPFGGTVPVPNTLFDELLPTLSDAELRVTLIVLRSTLGWRQPTPGARWQYKQRDWLTNRQLVVRTGSSSASVSRAVQSLLDRRVIRVEDAAGTVLATPEERRRNIGRLYFRLGDMWITPPRGDNAGARTTTDTANNNSAQAPSARLSAAPDRRPGGPVRIGALIGECSDKR